MRKIVTRINPFKNASIQVKITLCIMLVVMIPLVILLGVFSRPLYEMVMANTIRAEQNASSLTTPVIEQSVKEIAGCMDRIIKHPYYGDLFNEQLNSPPDALAISKNAYAFKDMIEEMKGSGDISDARIYIDFGEDNPFFNREASKNLFESENTIVSTYWHGIMDGNSSATLFCPPFYLSKYEISHYGDCAYIFRTTAYYNGRVYPAYFVLYYDSKRYEDVLKNSIVADGSVSYIVNDRDALVVTTNQALSGTYRLKYADIRDSLLASNSFVEREIAGVSVYVAFYNIGQANWYLVNVIPKAPVEHEANEWMKRFMLICILGMLLAMLIGVLIARSITSRIAAVSAQMAKVHDGPPIPLEPSEINDEVGELITTYNYMTQEMNQLIRKQEATAEELRIAEFNALQAQINPHFLYNTMDMINWMAVSGRNKEVSEVVQNLSRFYKLTLSRKKDFSTIENELEHASVYMELQNMRFGNSIDFVVDVPDELMQCRLPKLTFQPILENAILHGILETETKSGTIVLTVWTEGNDIKILISDDGAGMSEEIRSNILSEERIKPIKSKGTNVAIVNTHRRLQLLYGEAYGLSYESSPGNGCEVTIYIPKQII